MGAGDGTARREDEREDATSGDAKTPLCEELLGKIEALTSGQSIDLAEHIDAFPEIRKAFTIPFAELGLADHGGCEATLEDGGRIRLIGFIYVDVDGRINPIAEFKREIHIEEGFAEHKWLKVEPRFRGLGVSSALLLRTFAFYRELGIASVELEAGMQTGTWHWARVGFEFMLPEQRERVRGWAQTVVEALDLTEPRLEEMSEATQFARMRGSRNVTLGEIAEAFPDRMDGVVAVARENSLDLDDPIELGRAVMLTGPGWDGRLDLNGPSYANFKAYADSKAEVARVALQKEDVAPHPGTTFP
jgi:GNAT superfamily N-acetyltransferase